MSAATANVIAVLGADRRVHCGYVRVVADGSAAGKCSVDWFLIESSSHLPSPIISAPEVAIFQGVLHVFVCCTDRHIYHSCQLPTEDGAAWSDWTPVSDMVACERPASVVFREELHLFMRAAGDHVLVRSLDVAGKWGPISDLPPKCGVSASFPTATASSDALHVFTRGLDDRLFTNVLAAPPITTSNTPWTGRAAPRWLGWRVFPGGATSRDSPYAAAMSDGRLVLVVCGADGRFYWASSSASRATSGGAASGWTGFAAMPSVLLGAGVGLEAVAFVEIPDASGASRLLAVARDTAGSLHHASLAAPAPPTLTGPAAPAAVPAPAPSLPGSSGSVRETWTAWAPLSTPGLIAAGPSMCIGDLCA
jgi:hypothetical protein